MSSRFLDSGFALARNDVTHHSYPSLLASSLLPLAYKLHDSLLLAAFVDKIYSDKRKKNYA